MQLDLGSLWRHEQLRRIEESRRLEEAGRPSPPPAPQGRVTLWWQRVLHRSRRRGSEPVVQVPLAEIDLRDGRAPVADGTVAPRPVAAGGDGG